MFKKILIANRGEIACRVIRTARALGIQTVAVYSDADASSLHVSRADEAIHIGGSAPAESYLDIAKIISAAKLSGAEAIHPGYGFLSENADFCRQCEANNLVFIGPPIAAIEAMGSKSAAKTIMEQASVPLLPGYHAADQSPSILKNAADEIGYPVLLKAVAGGGGKGMREVHSPAQFDAALDSAKREARSSFGNDEMLVEKFLQRPRHIEVQVFCDSHGNGVYLFERDCSVQRRHQKILEEAPAPQISDASRIELGEAALRAAEAVNYIGAGTVEFLMDPSGSFYFMEMNTRLQVEHPVTEMITGQDLVEWQLKVASGQALPCRQDDLAINGHAFEARIYAEDPNGDFLPAAGVIRRLQVPDESAVVRIDTGVAEGDEVGVFYDPMIAKLIVWGKDRKRALRRLKRALVEYRLVGVRNNIDFLKAVVRHEAFAEAEVSTDFIDVHRAELFGDDQLPLEVLLPAACIYLVLRRQTEAANTHDHSSPWHLRDAWRMNTPAKFIENIQYGESSYSLTATQLGEHEYQVSAADNEWLVTAVLDASALVVEINGHRHTVVALDHGSQRDSKISLFSDFAAVEFEPQLPDIGEETDASIGSGLNAPMNGVIVDIPLKTDSKVSAGDTLMVMEAMKMEHAVVAPKDGIVREFFFKVGDLVNGGDALLDFEPYEQD